MSNQLMWALIVGAPRSGTSLLRRSVSSHPSAAILHEFGLSGLKLHIDALARSSLTNELPRGGVEPLNAESDDATGDEANRDIGAIWRRLRKSLLIDKDVDARAAVEHYYEHFYHERDAGEEQAREDRKSFADPLTNHDAITRALFEALSGKRPLKVVGSKVPITRDWQEQRLVEEMEHLRVILILRRPLDVLNSSARRRCRAKSGTDDWPIESLRQAVDQYNHAWRAMQRIAQVKGALAFVLKYEDLVQKPVVTLNEVFRFLELKPYAIGGNVESLPDELRHIYLDQLGELQSARRQFAALEQIWDVTSAVQLLRCPVTCSAIEFDERITFNEVYGASLLDYGFNDPEDWAVWTNGTVAQLRFIHPPATAGVIVELWIATSFSADNSGCIALVSVNDGEATPYSFDRLMRQLVIYVPKGGQRDDGDMTVRFNILRPKRPFDHPTEDPRSLGLAIHSVRLTEINASYPL